MDPDDLDDLLDGGRAEMEERFRELERQEEVERLRAQAGVAPPGSPGDERNAPAGSRPPGSTPPAAEDPLSDLKAAVEGAEVERYLLVECPHCQGKNRVALSKLRRLDPVCGRCRQALSFIKS
jgi:hypothetical protein